MDSGDAAHAAEKSRRPREVKAAAQGDEDRTKPTTAPRVGAHDGSVKPQPANDDGVPRPSAGVPQMQSAIVTVRDRKTVQRQHEQQQQSLLLPIGAIIGKPSQPDMTPEEHKRRGDAADRLFQDFKRLIAEKARS
jgi:hypothetical protein